MKPAIGMGERALMYAFSGIADLAQLIFDIIFVAEFLNHIIDIVVGAIILAYAIKRKLLDTNKGLTLLAVFAGEQIPFVNALPFWTFDIYNLYKGVPYKPQEPEVPKGVTLPRNQRRPVNLEEGVRRPNRGNIQPAQSPQRNSSDEEISLAE